MAASPWETAGAEDATGAGRQEDGQPKDGLTKKQRENKRKAAKKKALKEAVEAARKAGRRA